MSTESAILIELRDMHAELRQLSARLDATAPTPWPDRLRTVEAVLYIKAAYHVPKFSARTLYRWCQLGRLTRLTQPRRWLRAELDACMSGNEEGRLAPARKEML